MIKTTSNVPIHVLTHPQMEVDDEQGYPYFRKPPNQKRQPVHPPRFTPKTGQVWHHRIVLGDGSALGGQRRRRGYALLYHRAEAGTHFSRVWVMGNDVKIYPWILVPIVFKKRV